MCDEIDVEVMLNFLLAEMALCAEKPAIQGGIAGPLDRRHEVGPIVGSKRPDLCVSSIAQRHDRGIFGWIGHGSTPSRRRGGHISSSSKRSIAVRALNSNRSRPSCLSNPERRTISNTPGLSPASQTLAPLSLARLSPSMIICSAEYSISGTRLKSNTTTRGSYCA